MVVSQVWTFHLYFPIPPFIWIWPLVAMRLFWFEAWWSFSTRPSSWHASNPCTLQAPANLCNLHILELDQQTMHQDLRLLKICAVASENKTFHHHRRETIRFISTHIIFTNILFKNFISETLNWQILYVEILCLQISFSILLWSQRWHQLVDFGWVQIIGLQRVSMKTYVN